MKSIGNRIFCLAVSTGMAMGSVALGQISDGSFETPDVAEGFTYNPAGSQYLFQSTSGIIDPPSDFGGPATPAEGSQYAFLQSNAGDARDTGVRGTIVQTFSHPGGGDLAVVSLWDASREAPGTASYDIFIDDVLVASRTPTSQGTFTPFTTAPFTNASSTPTIRLVSTGPTDSTSFIDNLVFTVVPEPSGLAVLAAGAVSLLRRRRTA